MVEVLFEHKKNSIRNIASYNLSIYLLRHLLFSLKILKLVGNLIAACSLKNILIFLLSIRPICKAKKVASFTPLGKNLKKHLPDKDHKLSALC